MARRGGARFVIDQLHGRFVCPLSTRPFTARADNRASRSRHSAIRRPAPLVGYSRAELKLAHAATPCPDVVAGPLETVRASCYEVRRVAFDQRSRRSGCSLRHHSASRLSTFFPDRIVRWCTSQSTRSHSRSVASSPGAPQISQVRLARSMSSDRMGQSGCCSPPGKCKPQCKYPYLGSQSQIVPPACGFARSLVIPEHAVS